MNDQAQVSLGKARIATSLVFFLCGLGVATWAPMVPLAKHRLNLNEADLGLILLLLGAGSIVSMPLVGILINRTGNRAIILVSIIILALILPVLTMVNSAVALSSALFLFGASAGGLDVAMNAHAVLVQQRLGRHVMSSFHGMFSIGGLIGSSGPGLLMFRGLGPTSAASIISVLIIIIILTQYHHLLKEHVRSASGSMFSFPKGPVVILGVFCFIIFLTEGAMLDWSGLFLRSDRHLSQEMAGAGYAVFSGAMALMRFLGDGLVNRYGPKNMVLAGGIVASMGLLIAVIVPGPLAALCGFMLIGFGAANIVPVLFSAAGNIKGAAPGIALAAVTTMGYAGLLAGPASIGFIAYWLSLPVALGLLAAPLLTVSLLFYKLNK